MNTVFKIQGSWHFYELKFYMISKYEFGIIDLLSNSIPRHPASIWQIVKETYQAVVFVSGR